LALGQAGWRVLPIVGRGDDLADAAAGVDLLLIATPDGVIAEVAAAMAPSSTAVVAHCSGITTLEALAPHQRRASIHPLAALPSAELGAERLVSGLWFAVAGDPLAAEVVEQLGGRAVTVPDQQRVAYHAAAVIASNHLVALMGQVERVAAAVGLPLEAYLSLAAESLDNVARLGPAAALTGPVSRGDWSTVERHLAALDPEERNGYEAMAHLAAKLAQ
jgi:predicted short-subunit dehydrogenase-like oxidoreductase (DUF2520 family)